MVIRHSIQLLEQLSDLEEKINLIERYMDEMDIEWDRETLIQNLLAKKYKLPSGHQS